MTATLRYVPAKSVIIKSQLPDTDYVVNPYLGCSFGCQYCYASFMSKRIGEKVDDWGKFVYVKENLLSLFSEELKALKQKQGTGTILFSSVTDPYQPIERRLLLMRKILEFCCSEKYQGRISILTKSPLVTRDIDILSQLNSVEVGVTITCVNNDTELLIKQMEHHAPSPNSRLLALKKLALEGIPTYAFVGPLFPHLFQEQQQLENIFKEISLTGTKEVYVEYLNIKPNVRNKILQSLSNASALYKFYAQLDTKKVMSLSYNQILSEILRKYGLNLRLNKFLSHK